MITLRNKDTGLIKECTTGFSWTTLIFGFFVPLIRGDFKWAAILIILSMLAGGPTFGCGAVFVDFIIAFLYNKIYIRNLMERGFVPADEDSRNWCISKGLISPANYF